MKERFEGPDGRRYLTQVLEDNTLVKHDSQLAAAIAEQGTLCEFAAGTTLIEEGDTDNGLYFLIMGQASIYVHGKHVATRGPGELIGEQAVIDPAASRSATAKASNLLTALYLNEPKFTEIAQQFPVVWRTLALLISDKLRQRGVAIPPANPIPVLFVGSSTEGLPIARQIQLGLQHDPVDVRVWTNDIFGPSAITVDALLEQSDVADFALFVFGPDDKIASRDQNYEVPRDNVLFELGLFMGRLGRSRTFFVMQHGSDIKIPTDLLGVTPLTYITHAGQILASVVAPVCTRLVDTIKVRGVR